MRVAVICIDRPNLSDVRAANRSAHLQHIAESGVVEMAGPFLSPEGQMTGSLVVLTVETLAEAQSWAALDPYSIAGLFESVSIREWKKVIG